MPSEMAAYFSKKRPGSSKVTLEELIQQGLDASKQRPNFAGPWIDKPSDLPRKR